MSMNLFIRQAHGSNSMHYGYTWRSPIFTFEWPNETTPESIARNKEGVRSFLKACARGQLMISAEHSGYDYSCRRWRVTNLKLLLTLLINHLRLRPQRFGIADQFSCASQHRISDPGESHFLSISIKQLDL